MPVPGSGIVSVARLLGRRQGGCGMLLQALLLSFLRPKASLRLILSGLLVQTRRCMDALRAYHALEPEDDGGRIDVACAFPSSVRYTLGLVRSIASVGSATHSVWSATGYLRRAWSGQYVTDCMSLRAKKKNGQPPAPEISHNGIYV